jgi:uncharacterized membrane protein YccC
VTRRAIALWPGPFLWSAVTPWRAARVAAGALVPLLIGWASGRVDLGAFAALGAVVAGSAALRGVTRTRIRAVGVASIGMATSTFVGATIAASEPWLLVPVVMAWAYLAGITVSLGQTQSGAVLQWPVALLIAVGVPSPPGQAAVRAALVLAGGAFQGVLVAGSWMVRRGERERATLGDRYRALARYAADIAAGRFRPPAPIAFAAADALDDPNPLLSGQEHLVFVDMLEQAERVRASIAALAAQAAEAGEADPIRRLASEAATVLRLVVVALAARRRDRAAAIDAVNERLATFAVPTSAAWRWTGQALLGQLRAMAADLSLLADARPGIAAGARARARGALPPMPVAATQSLMTLRANCGLRSEAGRHALRLAVVAALAEVLVLATGLTEGRWVVLTIFIVLKPDYATTVYRGVQRSIGTMLGAGLGVAAVGLTHAGTGGLVAAAALSIAMGYATFDINYLVFSVFLTAWVVVLLDILGTSATSTAEARLACTAIGSALALVAYVVWPTWARLTAPETFARLLEAHRDYARALLGALGDPRGADVARLRNLQSAARLARSEAEPVAARLEAERRDHPFSAATAHSVLTAVSRLGQAELALHALLASSPHDGPTAIDCAEQPADRLAETMAEAMTAFATSLRTLQRPPQLPALGATADGRRPPPPGLHCGALIAAVDDIGAVLWDGLPSRGRPARGRAATAGHSAEQTV